MFIAGDAAGGGFADRLVGASAQKVQKERIQEDI